MHEDTSFAVCGPCSSLPRATHLPLTCLQPNLDYRWPLLLLSAWHVVFLRVETITFGHCVEVNLRFSSVIIWLNITLYWYHLSVLFRLFRKSNHLFLYVYQYVHPSLSGCEGDGKGEKPGGEREGEGVRWVRWSWEAEESGVERIGNPEIWGF